MLRASYEHAQRAYEIRCRDRATSRRLMRTYRARLSAGSKCLTLEISDWTRTINAFIAIGILAKGERDDKKAIGHAIAVLCRRGYSALVAEREAASHTAADASSASEPLI